MDRFCPRHFTIVDGPACDRDEVIPCPEPVTIDPAKHIIATCGPCDRTQVFPIERVMQGKASVTGGCVLSACAAQVVLPEPFVLDASSAGIDQKAKPRSPRK